MSNNKLQRIDKIIAGTGNYSRSQVKELIKKKKVSVNDIIVKSADDKFDAEHDIISVEGIILNYKEFEYYMLNKPAGVVSATNDNTCKTVLELIDRPTKLGLFPVGRLDKDTEGLLIITNDGELSHSLLSPRKHVDKTYYVETDGIITEDMISRLENGLDIGDDKLTAPAKAIIIDTDTRHSAYLTITEGRFHQVKRMFKAVGREVMYLKRISFGSLKLDETLKLGEYRPLSEDEISSLKNRGV